jgi:hypothetical protein
MKYFQLAILCFICLARSYGQTGTRMYTTVNVEIIKEKKPKRISTKVEITSPFPAGDSSWIRSLEKSLNESLPFKNSAKAGKYLVSVRLLIEKDGSMADYHCSSDPGYGMCEQVIGVMKRKFRRNWGPSAGTKRENTTKHISPQVSN